ncbi:Lrp/AsnC family transcriptional regulator [Pseudochelatococcus contaminans]|uniref:Lrp/AsnC family leucine-responsive transcriptional regulator n=1 Tax=Pseudochelatococcus contaminans TaxID=1538103 RepID=A0A7W5Z359_9HYPH|nr:Lrp/AsnC family transcriptional regulator [Pseudochelatococcus contaminans]MBB3809276.1 Lrp/AsnC family leucine-responsive transcriptional regulator [Pseudochelatococcus contaminans]
MKITPKAPFAVDLDRYDLKIIEALEEDGRMPIATLAERIGLSKSPCHTRLKRLIDEGYILGFRAVLDPRRVGLDHVAYTEVKLSDTREEALTSFNDAVRKIREVEECHMIAGPYDYLLKVRTANIRRYRQVLGESISSLPHVASTSTFIVMQAVKEPAISV